jgi:hypothetical protein
VRDGPRRLQRLALPRAGPWQGNAVALANADAKLILAQHHLEMHPRLLETDAKLRIPMGLESTDDHPIAECDGRDAV